jgi:hypothetical protein
MGEVCFERRPRNGDVGARLRGSALDKTLRIDKESAHRMKLCH